jgi:hypothetical protein
MKKALVLIFISTVAFAQKKKNDQQPTQSQSTGIASKVSGMKHHPGYFDFYYDEKQDKICLQFDKFNPEFL